MKLVIRSNLTICFAS